MRSSQAMIGLIRQSLARLSHHTVQFFTVPLCRVAGGLRTCQRRITSATETVRKRCRGVLSARVVVPLTILSGSGGLRISAAEACLLPFNRVGTVVGRFISATDGKPPDGRSTSCAEPTVRIALALRGRHWAMLPRHTLDPRSFNALDPERYMLVPGGAGDHVS
jgi:hypothetical protein